MKSASGLQMCVHTLYTHIHVYHTHKKMEKDVKLPQIFRQHRFTHCRELHLDS